MVSFPVLMHRELDRGTLAGIFAQAACATIIHDLIAIVRPFVRRSFHLMATQSAT